LLWRLSAALRGRGLRRLALLVKKINTAIYHNSLAPGATFSPDIRFGHRAFGVVIHSNVVIGRGVFIWHNVTIAVRASSPSEHRIVIEDDVRIGAGAVIVSPHEGSLCVGRGARIGAGTVISRDVPPGATVVSAPPRVILRDEADDFESSGAGVERAAGSESPDAGLGEVEARERAQKTVRDEHVDV
jgi:serine O-acetyltransferase